MSISNHSTSNSAKLSWMITMASIAIVVGALHFAKDFLLPLVVAVLISFLLTPICDWLERRRVGRVPAVLGTVLLTMFILGIMVWTTVVQLTDLAANMSKYQANIEEKLTSLTTYTGSALKSWTRTKQKLDENLAQEEEVASELSSGNAKHPYAVKVIPTTPSPLEYFGGMFGTFLEAITAAGIVIVLVLFFLFRREDLRDRFIRLVGRGQVTGTTDALQDATSRVSRYLLMQFLVNIGFGFATMIGLFLIGVPNALLWGVLTATLKFIPYIGVWIAAAAPTIISLSISNGWVEPMLTFSVFAVLEAICGNFLEPILFGKHTGVSAVAILVAAVFWAWLWGGVGLLLATPLTVCLLVIGKHVPQLSFLDTLLGDEPVFEPKIRVYQRLLAGDQEEAIELVAEHCKTSNLAETYDSILIPALCLAEKDRYRGEIDRDRLEFILQSMTALVDEMGDSQEEARLNAALDSNSATSSIVAHAVDGKVSQNSVPRIFCIPAASKADEIGALMLAQVARDLGLQSEVVSPQKGDMPLTDTIEDRASNTIYIVALPSAAVTHARFVYRQLRGRFEKAKIRIALLNYKGEAKTAQIRIGCNSAMPLAISLLELSDQLTLITGQAPRPSGGVPVASETPKPVFAVAK